MLMIEKPEDLVTELLRLAGENPKREGLKETPARFIKAWKEYTSGYGKDPAEVLKCFDDGAEECDQMVVQTGIPVWSMCEHHLAPFFGVAHIAYIPNKRIVGLSKLSRLTEIFARRCQVQERLTSQIAKALQTNLKPIGVGVVLECRHTCMECRGVKVAGAITMTQKFYGALQTDHQGAKAEFMQAINRAALTR